jgi:hypothetical protein
MERGAFLTSLGGGLLAAPQVTEAQPAGKMWRIVLELTRSPSRGARPTGSRARVSRHPYRDDARLVTQTGILPQINTGIAHRPGVGQIDAGLGNPPRACFDAALHALTSEPLDD